MDGDPVADATTVATVRVSVRDCDGEPEVDIVRVGVPDCDGEPEGETEVVCVCACATRRSSSATSSAHKRHPPRQCGIPGRRPALLLKRHGSSASAAKGWWIAHAFQIHCLFPTLRTPLLYP